MIDPNDPIQQVHQIRSIMERSSRFISLSGLSGVVAGVAALLGAAWAYSRLGYSLSTQEGGNGRDIPSPLAWELVGIATLVLVVATGFGLFFTVRNSKRKGQKIWDNTAKRLLAHLMLPLVVGGLFCLILLIKHQLMELIPAMTLVFYGLALVNASKYTLHDIRWLGLSEIVLGLIGAAFSAYGLVIWAIGFGILHILYGAAMWWKYER